MEKREKLIHQQRSLSGIGRIAKTYVNYILPVNSSVNHPNESPHESTLKKAGPIWKNWLESDEYGPSK